MSAGRILIVDDSDNIRNVLQMNFEWLGYQVCCARDGDEGLRMISESPPDLVILDVMMPRRNGYQVCRTVKSDPRLKHIPVIFLTAKDQAEDRFWGKDCGADEYLTKPFSAAKLERVIERLLESEGGPAAEGDITARVRKLTQLGVPCSLITFTIEVKALQVFRQKYGEIKHREATQALRAAIESIVLQTLRDTVTERFGEGAIRAVLPCAAEEAKRLAARVSVQCDLHLKSLYDPDDVERGYVVTRGGAAGHEIHVPLMAVEWHLAVETPAA